MGSVNVRTSFTSQGFVALSPWINTGYKYSIAQINLGNNFISSLEIVSSLNLFNLARGIYHYNYTQYAKKYNPKVYMGAVQTATPSWNTDLQNTQNWDSGGLEKSGSWPSFVKI